MRKAVAIALIVFGIGLLGVFLTFDRDKISSFGTEPVSVNQTVSAADASRLKVETDSIDVKLVPGVSDEINVRLDGKASKKFIKNFKLDASNDNGTIIIKAESKDGFTIGFNIIMVDLIIELPERLWSQVEVQSSSGEVEAADLNADQVQIHVKSGNIELERLVAKDAQVTTKSGEIELDGLQVDNMELVADSGNVSVENYQVEELNFSVKSGSIDLENGSGNVNGEAQSGNIHMEVEQLAGDVVFKVRSGNVRLDVEEDSTISANVRLTTSSGNHKVEWPSFTTESDSDRELTGSIGGGQYKVDITTASGNIKLENS